MSAEELISTSAEYDDGVAVLRVAGEVDTVSAPLLTALIADVLANHPSALVIDLSDVAFFGSAGLQLLVQTNEMLTGSVGLAIVANTLVTSRPIKLTGLEVVLPLYDGVDEALCALCANTRGLG